MLATCGNIELIVFPAAAERDSVGIQHFRKFPLLPVPGSVEGAAKTGKVAAGSTTTG